MSIVIPSTSSSGRIRPSGRDRRRNRVRAPRNRARRWAFTLNNPTLADSVVWNAVLLEGDSAPHAEHLTFFIVQTEKGDGSDGDSTLGTVHYQAYAEFKTTMSLVAVKRIFGDRVHVEQARANSSANIKYCTKERTRFEDNVIGLSGRWGAPKTVGMQMCAIKILNGSGLDQIVDEHPLAALLHLPKIENLMAYAKGPRTAPPKIIILTGLTGCGKSRYCLDSFGTKAYWLSPPDGGRVWWGHYIGQEVCIMDDFHSGWFTLTKLLRLFDRYPVCVSPKGGQVPFNSGIIVLTMNGDPKDLYMHYKGLPRHKAALARRFQDFAEIIDCSKESVSTPRGAVVTMKRVKRTELFVFNVADDSPATGSVNPGDYRNQAGVGDLPYGNYFN